MNHRQRTVADETLSDADRFVLSRSILTSDLEVFSAQSWVSTSPDVGGAVLGTPRGRVVRFVVSGNLPQLPEWLEPTLGSLAEVLELPSNWDSYGAYPIKKQAVDAALDILNSIMQDSTPPPSVVPVPDGGVQLEWHIAGVNLEITVDGTGRVEVAFDDSSSGGWDGVLPTDLPRLRAVVDRLSR